MITWLVSQNSLCLFDLTPYWPLFLHCTTALHPPPYTVYLCTFDFITPVTIKNQFHRHFTAQLILSVVMEISWWKYVFWLLQHFIQWMNKLINEWMNRLFLCLAALTALPFLDYTDTLKKNKKHLHSAVTPLHQFCFLSAWQKINLIQKVQSSYKTK